MVLNYCKGIEDYVRDLKNIFWRMVGLAKLLLKIVINNGVFMFVIIVKISKIMFEI